MDLSIVIQRAKETAALYNPRGLVPFPFQQMAESLGDLELQFFEITDEVSGAILHQSQDFMILINTQKPETRQYFTLAHEFGHYFLHAEWLRTNPLQGVLDYAELIDGQGMLLRPDKPQEATVDLQKEREANNFAAELIMPEQKVHEFWEVTSDIARSAEAFQVSKSAMATRLERLHLL